MDAEKIADAVRQLEENARTAMVKDIIEDAQDMANAQDCEPEDRDFFLQVAQWLTTNY